METKVAARWPRVVGYPSFFLICFVFFFHLTLPYGVLQERLIEVARQSGHTLTIGSLGPALGFGVTVKRLALVAPPPGPAVPGAPPTPVPPDTIIDQVSVRPTLFPPGLKISARAFGGDLGAQLSGWTAGTKTEPGSFTKVDNFTIKNLDLTKAGLKPTLGVNLEGVLNVEGDILHLNELPKSTGSLKISGTGLSLLGGTVAMMDLPKVALGTLDIRLKVDTGKATIDKFSISGGDVEAGAEGEITLNNRLSASQSKLKLEFKPSDAWLKANSTLKMGLSLAGKPDSKGFYTVNLDGMLGNLRPSLKQ